MNLSSIQRRLKEFAVDWDHWWTRDTYPHIMGIVRIALGGWLLFYWAIRLPNINAIYTTAGIVFPKIPKFMPEQFEWILQVPEPNVFLVVFGIHLIALLTLTIGYYTRTSALIACLISWYLYYIGQHHFHTSYDRLYMFSLLFLALSNAGAVYSYEAWEKFGNIFKWDKMVSIFPQRLLAFRITMTYLGVGFQKLWLP